MYNKTGPAVSVILPNYNHSVYLQERIESILNQAFQDFELIILDDCSCDNSKEIIDQYANHPKVSHIVYNQENSGSTFVQWQRGFDLAQGRYIWIAESDDGGEPVFLDRLVGELRKNKDAVLAFSHSYVIDEQGKKLGKVVDKIHPTNKSLVDCFEGKRFVKTRMLINNSIYNASMVVFKKEAIKHTNPLYLKMKASGDWLFWINVCVQGQVIRYNQKLNYNRLHATKVTSSSFAIGLHYHEEIPIVEYLTEVLSLTKTQQKGVIGKKIKSLIRDKKIKSEEIRRERYNEIKEAFGYGKSSVIIYELDKLFNISGLGLQKNKLL